MFKGDKRIETSGQNGGKNHVGDNSYTLNYSPTTIFNFNAGIPQDTGSSFLPTKREDKKQELLTLLANDLEKLCTASLFLQSNSSLKNMIVASGSWRGVLQCLKNLINDINLVVQKMLHLRYGLINFSDLINQINEKSSLNPTKQLLLGYIGDIMKRHSRILSEIDFIYNEIYRVSSPEGNDGEQEISNWNQKQEGLLKNLNEAEVDWDEFINELLIFFNSNPRI